MEWISDPQAWVALLTLTALEIVLGVDNIVFISILSARLPEEQPAAVYSTSPTRRRSLPPRYAA